MKSSRRPAARSGKKLPDAERHDWRPAHELTSWQQHAAGELLWTRSAGLTVFTEAGAWVAASLRAIWLPAGCWHQYWRVGSGIPESTFAEPDILATAGSALPGHPCAVEISPALAAVLPRLSGARIKPSGVELWRADDGVERWVSGGEVHAEAAAVFSREVKDAGVAPIRSPLPDRQGADAKLRPLLASLRQNPADHRSLSEWARILRVSPTTLNRALRRDIGLPFGAWRRQMRVLDAAERLAQGQSVAQIAHRLGYRSAAKFATMFARIAGRPPARYFDAADSEQPVHR